MHKLDLSTTTSETNNSTSTTAPQPFGAGPAPAATLDSTKVLRQNQSPMTKTQKRRFLIICVAVVIAGALTGFGAHQLKLKNQAGQAIEQVAIQEGDKIKNGDVFGVQNKDVFADSATGYLEAGGVEGEGSHKLLREGGAVQTVALTSSVVDLDKLVGAEVKIYGETFKAEKAGWFMDVGRVEVIEINGQAPLQSLD